MKIRKKLAEIVIFWNAMVCRGLFKLENITTEKNAKIEILKFAVSYFFP